MGSLRRVFTVDAFADVPFEGNPAAVVLIDYADVVDGAIDSDAMLRIAQEMNLSETAFVSPAESGSSFKDATSFSLRWFTPKVEVNLCGHATLAASRAIFGPVGNPARSLEFKTLSGTLVAKRDGDTIAMDLPANAPDAGKRCVCPELVAAAISSTRLSVVSHFYSPHTKKLGIVVSCSRAELESARVNPASLLAAHDGSLVRGVIITTAAPPPVRFFLPLLCPVGRNRRRSRHGVGAYRPRALLGEQTAKEAPHREAVLPQGRRPAPRVARRPRPRFRTSHRRLVGEYPHTVVKEETFIK